MDLTERQLSILQVIIEDYIETALPVGSSSLAKSGKIAFSSATIRNEMAELEEKGYIEKTHSSSGRVPSERGYRFYVDHLVSPSVLEKKEVEKLHMLFSQQMIEFEKLIQEAANILSSMTNYTSIVLSPELFDASLKQIQFIPVSDQMAVVILVTETGFVEHRTIAIPKSVSADDLEMLVRMLNDRLRGVPIRQLNEYIAKEMDRILMHHLKQSSQLYELVGNLFGLPQHAKLFFSGKENILSQPDFHDIRKLHGLYSVIEKEQPLYDLMKQPNELGDGIRVKIGKENSLIEMANCSLITATFTLDGKKTGTLALLGPTRMEYGRVISLLTYLSADLHRFNDDLN
ncbi:heat-inducible transcriptional repressor HrcA [Aureibacillus halotolerans]|uniref:Heat-inducible transcription repressor HrcA n=1 Tax=Aureibacillus halotolerans TaxID=1508390 RepID=A0A4V3D4Z3_9BACI|nr:heat-inducible transcriptional repressor HrcA [Aureibacillus halotolerans]TDQ38047.1 heat-inducible transcription repressor HrcA [Aureibacillus halotolerans]